MRSRRKWEEGKRFSFCLKVLINVIDHVELDDLDDGGQKCKHCVSDWCQIGRICQNTAMDEVKLAKVFLFRHARTV